MLMYVSHKNWCVPSCSCMYAIKIGVCHQVNMCGSTCRSLCAIKHGRYFSPGLLSPVFPPFSFPHQVFFHPIISAPVLSSLGLFHPGFFHTGFPPKFISIMPRFTKLNASSFQGYVTSSYSKRLINSNQLLNNKQ